MHNPPHGSHSVPQGFPVHGSVAGQVKVPTVAHWRAASQAVAAKVGTGQWAGSVPGGQTPHESPQRFPTQPQDGAGAGHGGGAETHWPPPSQKPAIDGIMHGGVALRQGGSMVQPSPHAFPAQTPAAAHIPSTCETQRWSGSQAFSSIVSTQSRASGAQA
jgi:hypothetical protein